jgi:hypothetical protein
LRQCSPARMTHPATATHANLDPASCGGGENVPNGNRMSTSRTTPWVHAVLCEFVRALPRCNQQKIASEQPCVARHASAALLTPNTGHEQISSGPCESAAPCLGGYNTAHHSTESSQVPPAQTCCCRATFQPCCRKSIPPIYRGGLVAACIRRWSILSDAPTTLRRHPDTTLRLGHFSRGAIALLNRKYSYQRTVLTVPQVKGLGFKDF